MKTLLSLARNDYKALKKQFDYERANNLTRYTLFGSWLRNRNN